MSNIDTVPFATTLHVRDHCLCLAAQRAARAVARRFDEALRPVGLTSGQFSLLMSLNRPHPPSIGSVAALLAMDRTTLTANLKPLERAGLLRTTIDPADRRSRLLSLTEDGHAVLSLAAPIWARTHAEVETPLGAGGAERLRTDLLSLAQSAADVDAGEPGAGEPGAGEPEATGGPRLPGLACAGSSGA